MTEHEGIKQDDCMRERTMSDGITDAERMKREEVERWRKMVKEQFVSELSTAELVGELCKRDGVFHCGVDPEDDYVVRINYPKTHTFATEIGTGQATILVVRTIRRPHNLEEN